MRPKDVEIEAKVYECTDCASRIEAPEVRICRDCGAELVNIGRPRDL